MKTIKSKIVAYTTVCLYALLMLTSCQKPSIEEVSPNNNTAYSTERIGHKVGGIVHPPIKHPPLVGSITNDTLTFYVYSCQFADTLSGVHYGAAGIYVETFFGGTMTDSVFFNNGHSTKTCKYNESILDTTSNKKLISSEDSVCVKIKMTFKTLISDTLKVYDVIPAAPGNRLEATFVVSKIGINMYSFTRVYERPFIVPSSANGTMSGVHVYDYSSPLVMTVYLP